MRFRLGMSLGLRALGVLDHSVVLICDDCELVSGVGCGVTGL